ncbi:MAG: Mth938-like domain-containing protein [Balneolaceae bacterium]|nr:Mth938-like domain-containing protein [Balneolaceae bacterium]
MSKGQSPKIEELSWGSVRTSDGQTYKDVKLWPGGSRSWDWNETGTEHSPGIQPADVEELIEKGSEEVILSRGVYERLQVKDETKKYLEERDIPFQIKQTEEAVETYNKLADERPVGALIHSTC